MINPYEHRRVHELDLPFQCEGFTIDDYVEYEKDGEKHHGYIYCFRECGYNWFAFIYEDRQTLKTVANIPVGELKKAWKPMFQ